MTSLQESEAEAAAGATAPRVSLHDIERKIESVRYTTADDAFGIVDPDMAVLTLCMVKCTNGFMVIGKSAPASLENFDIEKGRKFAYEDCIRQLWPLMGFALRDRLAASETGR